MTRILLAVALGAFVATLIMLVSLYHRPAKPPPYRYVEPDDGLQPGDLRTWTLAGGSGWVS